MIWQNIYQPKNITQKWFLDQYLANQVILLVYIYKLIQLFNPTSNGQMAVSIYTIDYPDRYQAGEWDEQHSSLPPREQF